MDLSSKEEDDGALDIYLPSSSTTLNFSQEDTSYISTRDRTGKFTKIAEDQTTENYIRTFDGFFKEMMGKVKTLKNAPALKTQQSSPVDIDEEKLFKNLKETPEVKETLDYIKGLDEEIKNVIDLYNIEKNERLQTQLEMCQEIQDHSPDREAALFLNLCNFEPSQASDDIDSQSSGARKPAPPSPDQFVKKNIELAREGFMANVSLTDEEKTKIEDLLRDEEGHEPVAVESDSDCLGCNAYFLTVDERTRMRDIDSELEKFAIDEKMNEKGEGGNGEYETMSDFLLEQNIKRLEKRLIELHDEKNEVSRASCINDEKTDANIDVVEDNSF